MKKIITYWFNRYRNCIPIIVTLLLFFLFANEGVKAQMILDQTEPKEVELDVIMNRWMEYTDAPNSLYHHLSGQACELLKQRADKINAIQTLEGWQQRQK